MDLQLHLLDTENFIFILTDDNKISQASFQSKPIAEDAKVESNENVSMETEEVSETSNHNNLEVEKENPVKNQITVKSFACDLCELSFKSLISLNRHKKEHIYEEKPHKCLKCSESFNVLNNLLLHQSIHNKDTKCPLCELKFRRFASFLGHIQTHYKSEYFSCKYCEEIFLTESFLGKHVELKHEFDSEIEKSKAIVQFKVNEIKPKNKIKKHQCTTCNKIFNKNCQLERHIRIHTKEKPFSCKFCEQTFAQKSTLTIHSLKHSGIKPHRCSCCSLSFSQRGNLKSHMTRIHLNSNISGTKYTCLLCSCSFRKLGTLNGHITKIHNKITEDMENVNSPEFQNLIKSQLSQLQYNMPGREEFQEELNREITGAKTIEEQNKTFDDNPVSPKFSNTHIKIGDRLENGTVVYRKIKQRFISNVRWLICSDCPKQFRRPSDLIRHTRIHTGEKPFECPVCKRRFSIKSAIKNHMRIHEKKKNNGYECSYCLKVVDNIEELEEHIVTHKPDYSFKCHICELILSSGHELRNHSKTHNKKIYKVKQNDDNIKLNFDIQMAEPMLITDNGIIPTTNQKNNIFAEQTSLRPHICQICGVTFKKSCHLKQHLGKHLGLRYKCHRCDKTFSACSSLNMHMQTIHTGQKKSFKCDICNLSFLTASSLKRHALSHSDSRKLMCPYCSKTFKNAVNCRKHIKIHKTEILSQIQDKLSINETVSIDNQSQSSIQPFIIYENDDNIVNQPNQELINTAEIIINPSTLTDVCNVNNIEEQNLEENNIHQIQNQMNLIENNYESNNINFINFLVLNEQCLNENGEIIEPKNHVIFDNGNVMSAEALVNEIENQRDNCNSNGTENSQQFNILLPADLDNCVRLQEFVSMRQSDIRLEEGIINTDNGLSVCNNDESLGYWVLETTEANNVKQEVNTSEQTTDEMNSKKDSDSEKETNIKSSKTCTFCSKLFKKPIDLRRHIRTHTKEKPFKCNDCEKMFSLEATLKSHKRTHLTVKESNPCNVCGKDFSCRGSLHIHMRIHKQLKPYRCCFCNDTFRTSGNRKYHEDSHIKLAKKRGLHPQEVRPRRSKFVEFDFELS